MQARHGVSPGISAGVRLPAPSVPIPHPQPSVRRHRWSFTLVRIAGIEIRVHSTFVLFLALVAWANAAAGEPVLPAIGWLASLFACVVVHELAHSLVSRRLGVPVHEIDLLPIGGMSRLERLPSRWEDELRIAAAGPVASIGLAVVLTIGAGATGVPVGPPGVLEGPVLARLVWVNLLLAAFNLLPAFPMDGGRVLRALLQRRQGRVEATRIAVRSSRWLVGAFVVYGLLIDVWLLLIALFVRIGGVSELANVELHETLDRMPVRPLLRPCVPALPASMDVDRALVAVGSGDPGPIPVVDGRGHVVGSIRAGDLWRGRGRTVGRRASPARTVDPGGSVGDALDVGDGIVFAVDDHEILGYVDPASLRETVARAAATLASR